MKKFIFVIFFSAIFILTGCSGGSDSKGNSIESLNEQIIGLEARVEKLENQVSDLDIQNKYLTALANVSVPQLNYTTFTPASKGYSVINTPEDNGKFFVSLTKLTKYVNGYKIDFTIGNPTNVIYQELKMKIYLANGQTQEITITKPILPGAWNNVTVIVSPATADDVGNIGVSIDSTNNIYLKADNRSNDSDVS